MSATNRGAQRQPADYYVTPRQTIDDFLAVFQALEPAFKLATARFLDPCAGGDATTPMAYPTALHAAGATRIVTLDLRPDSPAHLAGCDYLTQNALLVPFAPFDAVFTNPPYQHALAFVQAALADVRVGGFVAMLVRLNLYGTQKRRAFWQHQLPKYTLIHARRPCFWTTAQRQARRAQGQAVGTDATEYAHLVWQRGHRPAFSKTLVI